MRQLWALSGEHRLTVFGHGSDPGVQGARFVQVEGARPPGLLEKMAKGARLAGRQFEREYWLDPSVRSLVAVAKSADRADCVIVNDLMPLAAVLRLVHDLPILFDAHEYYPRQFEDRLSWRLFFLPFNRYLCRRYIPRVAAMTTVCGAIAAEYGRQYGLEVQVVTNAPPYQELCPSPVSSERIRLVHHGGAMRSRRLELMIEMADYLDERFSLDFMLVPADPGYIDELRRAADHNARVRFCQPVEMTQIPATINGYDMGVFLLPPTSFSYRYALPNKLFEFVQARLAVAVGPSPEMAGMVRRHGLGVVSDSFSPREIAARLNRLSVPDVESFKQAAHRAARELSFEANADRLRQLVAEMLRPIAPAASAGSEGQ